MELILEPLQYGFFSRGLIGVALVAAICAVVGVYVVLRGLSYIGDALAHAIFPGVIVAYVLKLNLFFGAIAASLVAAISIAFVRRHSKLREDSSIAIVFVGMFALGIMLLSRARTYKVDLENFLVGSALAVSSDDLFAILALGGFVVLVLLALHKELLLVSFDETEARVIGLPVELLNNLLLVLIALTVVLAIQMVGTVLVVSLLVTSSATARQLTNRFGTMTLVAAVIGVLAGVTGMYISYYAATSPGATIVMTNTVLFLLALAWNAVRSRIIARAPVQVA
jgi:manganese/iron transport system permease protein